MREEFFRPKKIIQISASEDSAQIFPFSLDGVKQIQFGERFLQSSSESLISPLATPENRTELCKFIITSVSCVRKFVFQTKRRNQMKSVWVQIAEEKTWI